MIKLGKGIRVVRPITIALLLRTNPCPIFRPHYQATGASSIEGRGIAHLSTRQRPDNPASLMLAPSLIRTLRRTPAHQLASSICRPVRFLTHSPIVLAPPTETETKAQPDPDSNTKVIRRTQSRNSSPAAAELVYKESRKYWRRLSLERSKMSTSGGPPFNNLTYYTFGTPNGLKPAIVLEELGLKYEAVTVDISKNTQKEDWYLAINPNGRIPALKDGDMRVFESGAIMLYLADCYDKSDTVTYRHGTPLYYEMLSWLMFQMGGIGPMQGQANHFRAMASARSDYGIKRYMDETKRLYSVLEIRLSKADWLAGDKYTLADIANYSWVRAGPILLAIDLSEWPGVDKWVKRIDARPAVQKAKGVPPSTRTPEEMQEMFKNMRAKIDAMENTDKH